MYICRIRQTWYFRVRIPADLRRYFPQAEIRKSLKTRHKAHAKALAKSLSFKAEQVFCLIRSTMLTDSQIKKLVNDYIHATLRECEEDRACGRLGPEKHAKEDLGGHLGTQEKFLSDLKEHRLYNNTEIVEVLADEILEKNGISLDRTSEHYLKFCRELLHAVICIQGIEVERSKGNYENEYDKSLRLISPPAAIKGNSPDSGMSLSEAIALYVKEKGLRDSWRSKTKAENESIYALLLKVIGDIGIKKIDRSFLLRYSDTLAKLPSNMNKKKEFKDKDIPEILELAMDTSAPTMSTRTRNKNLERVSSLFKWCVQQGYMDRNPAESLSAKEDDREDKQREIYSNEDLRKLMNSPVYTTKIPIDKPEHYWIPLIALYSGMRLEEICQLYLDDIRQVDDIWCFDINSKADKKLKSLSSERVIPIHPFLIEAGFLEYVIKLGANGKSRLWENLERKRDGYGHLFGKWYQRFNRKYITQNPKKVFHSFRHTLADNLKQREVPETIIAEILGHTQALISTRRYGKQYKPGVLLNALKKASFDMTQINYQAWSIVAKLQ